MDMANDCGVFLALDLLPDTGGRDFPPLLGTSDKDHGLKEAEFISVKHQANLLTFESGYNTVQKRANILSPTSNSKCVLTLSTLQLKRDKEARI